MRLAVGDATEDEEGGLRVVLREKIEDGIEARFEPRLETVPVLAKYGIGTAKSPDVEIVFHVDRQNLRSHRPGKTP
jgi:hypothetical protein